jgi:hypothetical protein
LVSSRLPIEAEHELERTAKAVNVRDSPEVSRAKRRDRPVEIDGEEAPVGTESRDPIRRSPGNQLECRRRFPKHAQGDEFEQRVEIIHESLLSAWPRLVRWQTQDAESTQLRDQLRQAAQMWEERSRPDDLLWTGTSFKEYELWRERYPRGLTQQEETFVDAMSAKATRRRRTRRTAGAAILTLALGVAAVTSSLWQQSDSAHQQALEEARRAEASKLLAMAQLRLGDIVAFPSFVSRQKTRVDESLQNLARRLPLVTLFEYRENLVHSSAGSRSFGRHQVAKDLPHDGKPRRPDVLEC